GTRVTFVPCLVRQSEVRWPRNRFQGWAGWQQGFFWAGSAGRMTRPNSRRNDPTMTRVTLIGAGGKMGQRLTRNLRGSNYAMRYVEISETGKAALADVGIATVPLQSALDGAEAV